MKTTRKHETVYTAEIAAKEFAHVETPYLLESVCCLKDIAIGRIDCLTHDSIIEVKLDDSVHTVKHAIGQLVCYSRCFPEKALELWLVVPYKVRTIPEDVAALCNAFDITVRFYQIDSVTGELV